MGALRANHKRDVDVKTKKICERYFLHKTLEIAINCIFDLKKISLVISLFFGVFVDVVMLDGLT